MSCNATFVRHHNEYEHPYGDIIYGDDLSHYIREFSVDDIKGKNVLLLGYVHPNHWNALEQLRFFNQSHVNALARQSMYDCPYTKRDYHSLVPIALFDNDVSKFFSDARWEHKPWYYDMAVDQSWNLRGDDPYADFACVDDHMSDVSKVMQGTGYTSGCIISDGCWSRVPVLVDIGIGGVMYCSQLVWHNK